MVKCLFDTNFNLNLDYFHCYPVNAIRCSWETLNWLVIHLLAQLVSNPLWFAFFVSCDDSGTKFSPTNKPWKFYYCFSYLTYKCPINALKMFGKFSLTCVSLSCKALAISIRRARVRYLLKWNSFSNSVNCLFVKFVRAELLLFPNKIALLTADDESPAVNEK